MNSNYESVGNLCSKGLVKVHSELGGNVAERHKVDLEVSHPVLPQRDNVKIQIVDSKLSFGTVERRSLLCFPLENRVELKIVISVVRSATKNVVEMICGDLTCDEDVLDDLEEVWRGTMSKPNQCQPALGIYQE